HFPLQVPEEWKRHDPDALELRKNAGVLYERFKNHLPEMAEADLRAMLANYYALIENLDWNMGRLVDTMRSLPGFEDTLIVYISDHGDYVGSHGVDTCKINHHEESIRIPAIFHWPGSIPAQGLRPELFSLVDLQATILGTIGLEIPPYDQGFDYSPALFGGACDAPEEVLIEMTGVPRWSLRYVDWRGLVSRNWKYAFYEDGTEDLHDLQRDPFEMTNLAASNPAMREKLKGRLQELLRETRDPYFDVLMDHGVTPPAVRDVSDRKSHEAGMRWKAGITPPKKGERYL
ncbi:MAG: sulfatase family protein, partial [Planctomycetota bacterium]